jgi:hypothetical protein
MIFIVVGILLAGGIIAALAFRSAPEGLEDARGFRPSRSPFAGKTARVRVGKTARR